MVRGIAGGKRPPERSLGGDEARARCRSLAGPDAYGGRRDALLFATVRRSHRAMPADAGTRSQLRPRPFPSWTRLPAQWHLSRTDSGVSKTKTVPPPNAPH